MSDDVYDLTVAQQRLDKIFQKLFWYDALPEDDEVIRLVQEGGKLHRQINAIEARIQKTQPEQT